MFNLQFSTDTPGFDADNLRREIADKLTQVADYIRNNGINWKDGAIRDGHNMRVGSWTYTSK